MTRAELSAGSGLSRRKIARFERGRGPISDGDRRALAAALDVEIEALVQPDPDPDPASSPDTEPGLDTDSAVASSSDDATRAESPEAALAQDDVDHASEPEPAEAPVAEDASDPEPVEAPAAEDVTNDTNDDAHDDIEALPDFVAPDALLREYLSMLLELRDTQRISPTSLRQEDLSELAAALGGTPEAIEARLMELLGTDEQEAWQLRTTILPSLGAASSRR
jgi:transcriptional regulator with XRE-family HTH domain